jgi:hypothetical protein
MEMPTPPSDYIPLPAVLGLSGPPQSAAAEAGRGERPRWRHLLIRDDTTGAFEPGNARLEIAKWYRTAARSAAPTRAR